MSARQSNVVPLREQTEVETPRYEGGWRAGKPTEDPAKLKSWGFITARPSEFLICIRGGNVVRSGQGAAIFKWPWESVAIVPTTVQRLHFSADQVTSEKVGVQVTGLAVYRIAQPLIAYRMLNFSFPERAQEKLQQLLVEMFVGAARRLVSNLTVEECLAKRKEGIAAELMREIAPVVSGSGRAEDDTDRGWGVVLDDIEIQDVRILSQAVFGHLQAGYRQEQERRAREAELAKKRVLEQGEAEAQRLIALAKLTAETEVRQRRQAAAEEAQMSELATAARVSDTVLAHEQAGARARLQADVERVRMDAEAEAARHAAKMAAVAQETAHLDAQTGAAEARRRLAEAMVALAELEAQKVRVRDELDFARARGLREIENTISSESIQLKVAQQLPQLAAAFQQKLGEIHITAIDGANPFGYVAAAVEGVMGLARSAGLVLPEKPKK
jgi:flotillin